ncbi:MAG: hypothetical protein C5S49_04355 [Candidatus Methanogaster sp.]|nr:MAG: hypothetical protein C5S49_04355 [ANME-2 cluster archaeon]
MNLSGITQTLETINIQPDGIHDAQLSEAFRLLLQLIEELNENNEKLKAENQKLRDSSSGSLQTGQRYLPVLTLPSPFFAMLVVSVVIHLIPAFRTVWRNNSPEYAVCGVFEVVRVALEDWVEYARVRKV